MLRTRGKLVIIVSGLLLLAAFISGLSVMAQEDEIEPEAIVFDISLIEYQIVINGLQPGDSLELEAGQPYTFNFVNDGTGEHEILFGQNAIELMEGSHLDYEVSLLDDVEVSISGLMGDKNFIIGVTGLIEFEVYPGQELSFTFTLPEDKVGEWEMGCFIFLNADATEENPSPTHFDVAMHRAIHVVSASE